MRVPFRLDFTTNALRRLSTNVVDVVAEDGTYSRAIDQDGLRGTISVIPRGRPNALIVKARGNDPRALVDLVPRLLGSDVDLRAWYRAARNVPWLAGLTENFRGLKPPRYPQLWEAIAHSIIFQQISIHSASAIMRRLIESLSVPIDGRYPFVSPDAVLQASDATLRAASLSVNKMLALRAAAQAIVSGDISEERLQALPSSEAAEALTQLRGIGPWSAQVILLRGLGRLDAFPRNDSGVAGSLRLLSGDPDIAVEPLLEALGAQRGMLYFHLLLGRLALAKNVQPR